MIDTLLVGGTVVDGSGGPGCQADVAIHDGRIVSIGGPETRQEPARATIDVTGLVVAPGFVDIHTHYDAQLFWDATASPSPLHGVTSVIGGNCGFTLAPVGPRDADYMMRLMARVEGMPLEALEAGLSWDWSSFPEWWSRLTARPLAVNAGFLVGHSALRRAAMGDAATSEPATTAQVAEMVRLAHAAMAAGALGFSTSQSHSHHDGAGRPVPSRAATRDELLALAAAVRDHPGTTLETIVAGTVTGLTDDEVDLMTTMSLRGGRPINWNNVVVDSENTALHEHQLAASSTAAERGARIVGLLPPAPVSMRLSLRTGFVFDALPGWAPIIALPIEERMRAFADRDVQRRLAEGAASPEAGLRGKFLHWPSVEIAETFSAANARYEGKRVGEIARDKGMDPFEALMEIALADELRTGLAPPAFGSSDADWRLRAQLLTDERTIAGGSDAGAHVDMMCGSVYTTSLLAEGVRARGLLPLEEAVRQLSDVPARLYGLRERGRIEHRWWADLVVFDPDAVAPARQRTVNDLPGGASRLYAEAVGVHHVFVNGVEVARHGEMTGNLPGRHFHSGLDTETISVPGAS